MAQGYIGQNQVNMDSTSHSDDMQIGDLVVWKTDKGTPPTYWTVVGFGKESMGEKRIIVREHGKELPDWETWAKWFKKL
jgi:hypothetical protein